MEELTLFRSVLTVAVVLLLAWWCSRLLGKQWAKTSGSRNIKLLEQIQVGQNQRIILLKAGEEHYLIGVSQAGIQLISKLDGEFEAAELSEMPAGTQVSFRELMEKHLSSCREKMGGKR